MNTLATLATGVIDALRRNDLSIVTAESCTAGKLSTLLSEVPGAGEHLHGGFVTYTKAAKMRLLGVSETVLSRRGAVCEEVAAAMAEGALERSPASIAVAITGVAGPEPDEDNNPVGLVCVAAVRRRAKVLTAQYRYGNPGREQILDRAMTGALRQVLQLIAEAGHEGTAEASPAGTSM